MIWTAQTNSGVSTCGSVTHALAALQNEGQGPGPEGRHQLLGKRRHLLGVVGNARHAAVKSREVNYQRMVCRAPLGGKHLGNGIRTVGIRPQAINRLGWKAHQTPSPYCVSTSSYGIRSNFDAIDKLIS